MPLRGRNPEQGGVGQGIDVFNRHKSIVSLFKLQTGITLIYFGQINVTILITFWPRPWHVEVPRPGTVPVPQQ